MTQAERKLSQIANGYSTPFWVKELIATVNDKDIVDVANWLEIVAELARQRACPVSVGQDELTPPYVRMKYMVQLGVQH